MTVDELNIKITADAKDFTDGMATAIKALSQFRTYVRTAASEAKSAFGGLIKIGTEMSGENGGKSDSTTVTMPQSPHYIRRSAGTDKTSSDTRTTAVTQAAAKVQSFRNAYSRTANVLDLDTGDTVIGAVSAGAESGGRPIEITTTVELDGDKVGESVNRYFMGRDRVTNGLDR